MYTSGSITSSQRMLTEINETMAIGKIRISGESGAVKHLKALTGFKLGVCKSQTAI